MHKPMTANDWSGYGHDNERNIHRGMVSRKLIMLHAKHDGQSVN